MSNFSTGNAISRVRVVDMETGRVLQPFVSPIPPPPPPDSSGPSGQAHSDWDAKALIASWAAVYPEMTDLIREWVEDAWRKGFTIQLTESVVRRRAEIETPRVLAQRAERQRQIDDPVTRRRVVPANAHEAQLIALKNRADQMRSGASVSRSCSQGSSSAPLPSPVVASASPPFEFGLSRMPPELQAEKDEADRAFAEAVAQLKEAEENLERTKAELGRGPDPVDAPPPTPEKKTLRSSGGFFKKRGGS